ncbi:MAG: TolC family protein [Nannocystaceae bacterium]
MQLALVLCVTFAFAMASPAGAEPARGSQPGVAALDPPLAAYRSVPGPDKGAARTRVWWQTFDDSLLDALVEQGLEHSYELAVALGRIEEADAVLHQALAPLLPRLSWDTAVNVAPLDSLGFQFGGGSSGGGGAAPGQGGGDLPSLYYMGSSALNLSIELDVAGRKVLARRASQRDLAASHHDRDDAARRLVASIVSAYYDIVTSRAQKVVVVRQLDTSIELLELTELRFRMGQANAGEVLQQRQQLASARTLLPRARIQERAFEHRLALLLAQSQARVVATAVSLPELGPRPAAGRPGDLLATRPDLRAAAERLEGARRRERSARRDFAPSLRLSGQSGMQFIDLGDVSTQWFWGVGATLSVPIYNGAVTLHRLRQRQAQTRTLGHQLSAATLAAAAEVDDAWSRETQQSEVLTATRSQSRAADEAFAEAKRRYRDGLGAYLGVLAALQAAHQAELSVITAQRDLIAARIQLHLALGDLPAPARQPEPIQDTR